ncbi:MAG: prephenate dehydrogenase/arogenate dehydrogenase family protein [Holophagales bacterium]|nr:prephenate dehydrogenase/arogenate dehydrogenase family protein [Holophagales bacterium]
MSEDRSEPASRTGSGASRETPAVDTAVAEHLAQLREQIAEVDRSLLELLRRRMDLAEQVGREKITSGRPILVPEVHDRVLNRARLHAEHCGVSEAVMESIFAAVMRGSVERQHRLGVALEATGSRRVLIVGGAGNMGGWIQQFAQRLGSKVDIVDPAMAFLPRSEGRFGSLGELDDIGDYAAIWVSVPLGRMPRALEEVVETRPRGLVIEIASIKDHLRPALERADDLGVSVASLHPMFGPSKSVYETLTFVLACRLDPQSEKEAIERWLRHPYTHLVPVPFDHHDRLMGWLLGLAHLSGMVFGSALTRSGLGIEELEACASTTYDRQVSTASSVLSEDPDLYYDIQQLNPHRGQVYKAARAALDELIDAVQEHDRESFREVLSGARHYMSERGS